MQVRFGASTWLWTSPFNADTLKIFPKIKKMGFDVVEIPIEDPALIDVHAVKKALVDNGLNPVICGAFGPSRDFTHDDPAFHNTCFQYLNSCFEIAESLGADFVAGPMYSSVGKARLVSADQKKIEWERAVKNLSAVCVMASDRGLKIALEPLNRFESDLVNTAADVMRLVNDIDHPAACVLLDAFHMNLEENDLEKAIRLVGNKLIHVQVSENHRGVPGTGQTRWDKLKRGLESIGYNGVITIESFTPAIKELAGAVCIWRSFAGSQDEFASDGLRFLRSWAQAHQGVLL